MKNCKFCGKAHPFKKRKCPAWGVECTKCGGRNHFAIICTTLTKKVYNLRDESFNGMEYITSIVAQLEMIHAVTQEHDYPNVIYTEMLVDKTEVKFPVISDNGPQFTADEFAEFSKKWDFEHLTSSPGNSKANGKAESGVKTAMRILKKSIRAGTDPYLSVFDYRNTPTQGMTTSPAQRLMSRRTKTLLSTTQNVLLPRTIDLEIEKKELRQRQQAQAKYYSRSAKDLPSLSEDDVVSMKPFQSWRQVLVQGPSHCKA